MFRTDGETFELKFSETAEDFGESFENAAVPMQTLIREIGGNFYALKHLSKLYCCSSDSKQVLEPEDRRNAKKIERDLVTEEDVEELLCLVRSESATPWVRCWAIWQLGLPKLLDVRQISSLAIRLFTAMADVIHAPRLCMGRCQCSKNSCAWRLSRWSQRVIVKLITEEKCVPINLARDIILKMLKLDGSALSSVHITSTSQKPLKKSWPAEENKERRDVVLSDLVLEAELWLVWVLLDAKLVNKQEARSILYRLKNSFFEVCSGHAQVITEGGESLRDHITRYYVPLWRSGTRIGWILQGIFLGVDVSFKLSQDTTKFRTRQSVILKKLESFLYYDCRQPVTFFVPYAIVCGGKCGGSFSRLFVLCNDDIVYQLDVSTVGPFARFQDSGVVSSEDNTIARSLLEKDANGRRPTTSSQSMGPLLRKACAACGVVVIPLKYLTSGSNWNAQLCTHSYRTAELQQQLFCWFD